MFCDDCHRFGGSSFCRAWGVVMKASELVATYKGYTYKLKHLESLKRIDSRHIDGMWVTVFQSHAVSPDEYLVDPAIIKDVVAALVRQYEEEVKADAGTLKRFGLTLD